jgi:ribosomal-protein-alanine acetyltransferase
LNPSIRPAHTGHLSALVGIENRSFTGDRLSRERFRYLLTRARAATLVAEVEGAVAGYATVLFRRGASLARLYSIAVDPTARGQGLGRALLEAAEDAVWARDCPYLRLEVRVDDESALTLYRSAGYHRVELVPGYYEDGTDALRMEKTVGPDPDPSQARVPYFPQSLEFTCGPASLLMAMKALDPRMRIGRALELRIWREATTIFMTSGHGGCGPIGLALSARHRGFPAEVWLNDRGVPLVDSVRSAEKKEVMRLVHEDMLAEARRLKVPVHYEPLPREALGAALGAGSMPLVLFSSYRIYQEKTPHWIVVTGIDERFVYANDPYVDREAGESEIDSIGMPVPVAEFARMARYGRAGLQAVVLVHPREGAGE